ncbi:PREDICTED: ran-binding protein 3-like isoform X1 [Corvus brachyrhynchos]|uniref:ran-binding protein 3-like isoform X1 n=1 Tax=Corvus brachyrhynchos TaxID=85066 RepID=UPI00081646AF|nr:PREDICTED: ran-binding protein 3-like isoform X1 [Corvus brachyrhynchos]
MRNEPIPACKGNVFCAGTRCSCADCELSVRPRRGAKVPDLPKRRDWPGGPWPMHQAAHLQERTMLRPCRVSRGSILDPKEECFTEKSVLAQPTFVFEKKDHSLKRPAEDPVCKAENDFMSCSRKRARSSSLTLQKSDSQSNTDTALTQKRGRSSSFNILPTFPPSQTVKKNNIFMTSALLQRNPDFTKSTREGSLSPSQLWNVIRPATLQPPQALTCPEIPVVSLVTKKEACVQLSEDSSYSSAENSVNSKTAVGSSTTVSFSSSQKTQNQLLKERSVQNSSNSDFVFGENMVERVLVGSAHAGRLFIKSPEKHPKLCNEADLHKGEITSMSIGSCHVGPQTKRALLRNATLIESAAAFISKPVEKILLDKVEVITGEEAEHNVLQINCKLFVFNKLSLTWTERGRGSLRLNDTSSNKHGLLRSRLIMRNQGSLRLILNTRLWEQMVIKRANRKSLCFTATDQEDHSVQVFLTQASSKDTEHLFAAIHHRLVALRSFAEQEPDAHQVDTESETAFQPLNCDSDDEDDEELTQVSSTGSDESESQRLRAKTTLS